MESFDKKMMGKPEAKTKLRHDSDSVGIRRLI
jgi:hypothetical protein